MESLKHFLHKRKYIFILILIGLALLIYILIPFVFSQNSNIVIYKGIRYNMDLHTHISLGTNSKEFQAGDNYPDFSPVVPVFNKYLGVYNRTKPIPTNPPARIDNLTRFTCTGILIDEKWVLTAVECVLEEPYKFVIAERVGIVVTEDYLYPKERSVAKNVYIHPAYLKSKEQDTTGFNIALMELDKPVKTVKPAIINREAQEIMGGVIFASGFGEYNFDKKPAPLITKRAAYQNILDRLVRDIDPNYKYPNDDIFTGGIMAIDFDAHNVKINTLGDNFNKNINPLYRKGNSNPNPTEYEGCGIIGYKGSPAFQYIDNEWKVIGIQTNSYNPRYDKNEQEISLWDYGTITDFTLISEHIEWIDSIMK